MAPEQFDRARGRAGARIEQGDVDLALREGLVEHWHIRDNEGEEGEPQPCLEHDEQASQRRVRQDVADPKGEEGRAAAIQGGPKTRVTSSRGHLRVQAPQEQCKPADQPGAPHADEQEERERAIVTQVGLTALAAPPVSPRGGGPQLPGRPEDQAREPQPAGGSSRQHDRLEGIQQYHADQYDPDDRPEQHQCPPCPSAARSRFTPGTSLRGMILGRLTTGPNSITTALRGCSPPSALYTGCLRPTLASACSLVHNTTASSRTHPRSFRLGGLPFTPPAITICRHLSPPVVTVCRGGLCRRPPHSPPPAAQGVLSPTMAAGQQAGPRHGTELAEASSTKSGIDGWEATRRIKAHAALCDIPIIGLSAHAMTGDAERVLHSG